MSKIIAIADEVYRRLKREIGDRSFSEVIAAHLDTGGGLADVTGQQIFAADTARRVKSDSEALSKGTLDRLEE